MSNRTQHRLLHRLPVYLAEAGVVLATAGLLPGCGWTGNHRREPPPHLRRRSPALGSGAMDVKESPAGHVHEQPAPPLPRATYSR